MSLNEGQPWQVFHIKRFSVTVLWEPHHTLPLHHVLESIKIPRYFYFQLYAVLSSYKFVQKDYQL